MGSRNEPLQLTVDVAACYPLEPPAASTTPLFVSHDEPHAVHDFYSCAGTSPVKPMPTRVASFDAPKAPEAKKMKSFFFLNAPVEVWWDAEAFQFEIRDRTDLIEAGKLEAFKSALDAAWLALLAMGDRSPGSDPPPPPFAQDADDAVDPPVGSPSYSPRSPPPEETVKFLERELERERAHVREIGEAYTRLEKLHHLEKVTAGLLRNEHFEQLLAHAKAAAKPAPFTGGKRPASAMM